MRHAGGSIDRNASRTAGLLRLSARQTHGVLHEFQQCGLGGGPVPGVGHHHWNVGSDRERLMDVIETVMDPTEKGIDGDHKRNPCRLELVDHGEAVLKSATSDHDHGTNGTANQVIPDEVEAILTRSAEQVEDEVVAETDTAEVHRNRGRGLLCFASDVDALAMRRERRLGRGRFDLRDRTKKGALPTA